MISSLAALFVVFAAVLGSSAMIGMIVYFMRRLEKLEAKMNGELDSPQAVKELEIVQDELLAVNQTVSELSERLDFTEKLLANPDPPAAEDEVS